MSREIKFRAWDEEAELMMYSDEESGDFYFGFDKGKFVCWVRETIDDGDDPPYDVGRAIDNVMQFTGLHDKNGKEIYEGDICKLEVYLKAYQKFPAKICEMVWSDWHWGWALFDPKTESYETRISIPLEDYELEVIGNRFENPELLEKKQ